MRGREAGAGAAAAAAGEESEGKKIESRRQSVLLTLLPAFCAILRPFFPFLSCSLALSLRLCSLLAPRCGSLSLLRFVCLSLSLSPSHMQLRRLPGAASVLAPRAVSLVSRDSSAAAAAAVTGSARGTGSLLSGLQSLARLCKEFSSLSLSFPRWQVI